MVKVSKGRRVEDEAMALAMIRQADMEEMFIKVRGCHHHCGTREREGRGESLR